MMQVLYKCRCMLGEASVTVRDRADGEDVRDWMQAVRVALGADHARRSPSCIATATEYVKIPMPENAPFIGGKPVLNA